MNLLNLFEEREPHQQAIDKLEQARIDYLKEKMDYYAKHGMAEQFKKAKEEHDSYFKVQDECMGYGSVVGEAGIPGNVPADKIPGKEDLLKGKGRSYYESVEEGNPSKKVFKDKAGKPVGEIGIDPESSPGNGEWYVYHYGTGYSVVGFDNAAEAKRELMYVHKHPEAVEGHESTFNEAGIPGSVPTEKIPGKEDLLKGKGRSYYEAQDQKKNSKVTEDQSLHIGDPVIVTAPNEFEGKTGEISELSPSGKFVVVNLYNHGQHSMHLSDVEYNQYAADQEDEDDWYDAGAEDTLEEEQKEFLYTVECDGYNKGNFVNKNDAIFSAQYMIYYGEKEYNEIKVIELKTGDVIWEWHGKKDDNDVAPTEIEVNEAGVNPQFIVAQVTKLLATEARRVTNAPMAQLLAPVMKEYGLTLQQIDSMIPGGLKKAAGELGIMMKEGWSNKMVAQRTGQAPTPYSVYIKGKEWKSFPDDDHAENVANKLRAKFKQEGRDPSVITIAPTGYDKDIKEAGVDPNAPFDYDAWSKSGKKPRKPGIAVRQLAQQTRDAELNRKFNTPDQLKKDADYRAYRAGVKASRKQPPAPLPESDKYDPAPDLIDLDSIPGLNLGGSPKPKSRLGQGGNRAIQAPDKVKTRGQINNFKDRLKQKLKAESATAPIIVPKRRAKAKPEPKFDIPYSADDYVPPALAMASAEALDRIIADPSTKETTRELAKKVRAQKKKGVAEVATDYSKRRQHERDIDAGKPVAKQRQPKMTDYQKRRAQQKREMELGESQDDSGVEQAILHRIMVAHTDLLKQFGPQKVMQAAEEVAYNVGDVDEIGTSDVSAYVQQVKQILGAE